MVFQESSMEKSEYYSQAFARNLGLITKEGQVKLAETRIAIAGAGGVGGIHLLTLARLGIGKFTIADFDEFEIVNINRQYGAMTSTVGKNKADVLAGMVQDINPYIDIVSYGQGVTDENLDAFLDGCQIFIDGIDFFEIDIRRKIFKRCQERGIWALTAAPLGFGATLQVFDPKGMSFDRYFGINDSLSHEEKIAAFAVGLAPHPYHIKYLDLSKVSFARRTGPAVSPACTLAASLVATEVVKIALNCGKVRAVPCYQQIDLMCGKVKAGCVWFGGMNPLQKIKRKIILNRARKIQ